MPRARAVRRCLVLAAAVLAAAPAPVRAHPEHDALAPEPVVEPEGAPAPPGAPPRAVRLEAARRFREANEALREALFVKAADGYRAALALWDHPAIHFNLALALVNLDDPVAVHDELEKALAQGPGPLGQEHHDRGADFLALVRRQIVDVELSLAYPHGRVLLDGREVLVGAGTWKGRVRAGRHEIRGEGEGMVTSLQTEFLEGGTTFRREVTLYTDTTGPWIRRPPVPRWVPWAMTGGGFAVGFAGGILHASGRAHSQDYAEQLAACLPMDPACGTRPELVDLRNRAASRRHAAFALYGASGALVVVGVALMVHGRPRAYRVHDVVMSPAPVVGKDVVGLAAAGTF